MNLEDSSAGHSHEAKAMDSAPGIYANPSLTDNHLNDAGVKRAESGKETRQGPKRAESGKETRPGPKKAPTIRYPTYSFGNRTEDAYTAKRSKAEVEADVWEEGQMIRIKNR